MMDFRSYLEKYWASKFDSLNIKYEYEKYTFNVMDGKYIPDFYFPESNTFFEVKGHHLWEGNSTKKSIELNKVKPVIKGTSEGTFHFANSDKSICYLVCCNRCSKVYFTSDINKSCISCENDSLTLLVNGEKGFDDWDYINDEYWLFSKKEYDHMYNTLDRANINQMDNLYEKLHGTPKAYLYNREKEHKLSQLKKDHPNKLEVINYIENVLEILTLTDHNEIYIPPILLVGSVGCGKTAFAKSLSKILMDEDLGLKLDLNTGGANFTLVGNAQGFRNAYPGKILLSMSSISGKPVRNPIVLLDEIDKIKLTQFSCEDIFLSLLEKENSKGFTDEFFNIPIDASGISYIALANELTIPEPVLNRFNVFHIRDYLEREIKDIVIPNIFNKWKKDVRIKKNVVPEVLSSEIVDEIFLRTNGDIRDIKNVLYKIGAETIDIDENNNLIAFKGNRVKFIVEENRMTSFGIKEDIKKVYKKTNYRNNVVSKYIKKILKFIL